MNIKGSLPLLILNALSQGPSHGYQIAKDIRIKSAGVLDFKEGTLYPTLHKLEKQGLIESYEELEKGRTRRYYRLTPDGSVALERELAEWEQFTQAVKLVLGEA
jgi:PadR family transcriptional regulator PadR